MRLIQEGYIDINQRCEVGGLTPLMAAAGDSRIDIVEELLERGANPNITDAQGNTVLFHLNYLTGENVVEMIKLLKRHGMNINIRNNQNQHVMWLLCSGFYDNLDGFMQIIRLLFNYGIDMVPVDHSGQSLIQHAQRSKAKDLVIMSGLFLKAVQENDDAMIRALLTIEPTLACVTYNGKNCLDIAHVLYNWRAIAALNEFFIKAAVSTVQSL
jgi:ankyrin repeat protein